MCQCHITENRHVTKFTVETTTEIYSQYADMIPKCHCEYDHDINWLVSNTCPDNMIRSAELIHDMVGNTNRKQLADGSRAPCCRMVNVLPALSSLTTIKLETKTTHDDRSTQHGKWLKHWNIASIQHWLHRLIFDSAVIVPAQDTTWRPANATRKNVRLSHDWLNDVNVVIIQWQQFLLLKQISTTQTVCF